MIQEQQTSAQAIQTVDQVLRAHVHTVMSQLGWNMVRGAHALGMDRRTLYRWLKGWGVDLKLERARSVVRSADAAEAAP